MPHRRARPGRTRRRGDRDRRRHAWRRRPGHGGGRRGEHSRACAVGGPRRRRAGGRHDAAARGGRDRARPRRATWSSRARRSPQTLWRAVRWSRASAAPSAPTGWRVRSWDGGWSSGWSRTLLHATERDRRPGLVLVTGPPGVGKTRLGWELEKYVDGLAETVFWHRGWCPRFGEDTAYWALGEIVRARLGVVDEDDLDQVEDKLARTLHDLFESDADRAFVGIRLGRLLGLPGGAVEVELTRSELFAGWRRFFEEPRETAHRAAAGGGPARRRRGHAGLRGAPRGLGAGPTGPGDRVRAAGAGGRATGLGSGRGRSRITLAPLGEAAMRELLAGLVAAAARRRRPRRSSSRRRASRCSRWRRCAR